MPCQSATPGQTGAGTGRPSGAVRPEGGPALLGLKAIDGGRFDDARRHVEQIRADSLEDQAWRAFLYGMISAEQGESARTEPLFLEAAACALAEGMVRTDPIGIDLFRLGARALHGLGRLYRRSERCEDARRVHLAAYRIREVHGSREETWESATELGLDADVARDHEDGTRWHRSAVETAAGCREEPWKKQAQAWTNLAASLDAAGELDNSVEALRSARDCWYRHDPTSVTAVQADARLGKALLKLGERMSFEPSGVDDGNELTSAQVLAESVRLLADARDALLAFGPGYRSDADACLEQQDVARRLDTSLGAEA